MVMNFVEIPGEAAFMDQRLMCKFGCNRREFTLATNQVDFAVPSRFDLTYTDNQNKHQTLYVFIELHGTHERFIGFLIEHFAGNLLWLSPVQMSIIPVSEKFNDYANTVYHN